MIAFPRILLIALTALPALMWTAVTETKVYALEVTIREEASVRSDVIRLGDVASFDPEGDKQTDQLKKVEIGSSPAPGKAMVLSNQFLIYRIGPVASNMDDVKFKVPENLTVHRLSQSISVERLTEIFKQHVLENAPLEGTRIHFEQISVPGPLVLPPGNVTWEVKNRGGDDYVGDVSLVVNFLVDKRLVRKLPLSGRISVDQEILKTTRKIKSGELIGREDVVLTAERDLRIREKAVHEVDQVIGKKAARSLQSGQMITQEMVEDPPLVQKGDRVIIMAENGSIRISTIGKALEDGRGGEQVKVVNISSGKEILATVSSPGRVSVAF